MGMLEKASRAAFEAWGGAETASGKSWEEQSEMFRQAFRDETLAILKSIRDPDEAMIEAGLFTGKLRSDRQSRPADGHWLGQSFTAMIDTIIGEQG